jgi:hypothetical protein
MMEITIEMMIACTEALEAPSGFFSPMRAWLHYRGGRSAQTYRHWNTPR